MNKQHKPRAYLAGPDVFFANLFSRVRELKWLCETQGIEGVFPLDDEVRRAVGETEASHAYRIRQANIGLIHSCQLVLANVQPFRGPHADDGTAFEVGYATALGKPVFCYSFDADKDVRTQVLNLHGLIDGRDRNGSVVEDFGLPVNLMLVNPEMGSVHRSAREAVLFAAKYLKEKGLL